MSIKQQFNHLRREIAALESNTDKSYWERMDRVNALIRALLGEEFTTLSHGDFLQLCSWVSRYRPVEPHRFLLMIDLQRAKKATLG